MLIALLVVRGGDLVVLVVFLLMRKSWVMRQSDAFRRVIRVAGGQIDGLRRKWARWYGRWVRDMLAWTKAPSLFQNEAVAADGLDEDRPARPDEVKRLGDHPTVIRVRAGSAAVEAVADRDDSDLLLGPYRKPVGATVGAAPSGAADDAVHSLPQ